MDGAFLNKYFCHVSIKIFVTAESGNSLLSKFLKFRLFLQILLLFSFTEKVVNWNGGVSQMYINRNEVVPNLAYPRWHLIIVALGQSYVFSYMYAAQRALFFLRSFN